MAKPRQNLMDNFPEFLLATGEGQKILSAIKT
jgi:hypothetical protein